MSTKALSLNLNDSGQNFAGVATIRQALFDVIDHGDQDDQPWMFYENEDPRSYFDQDAANVDRSNFVDAVIARIAELQNPPHEGIKLENLCDKHKRQCLPAPTSKTCRMCDAERKELNGNPRT